MKKKPAWESKTLWANVLTAIAILFGAADQIGIPAQWATVGLAVINIALRFVSGSVLTMTNRTE